MGCTESKPKAKPIQFSLDNPEEHSDDGSEYSQTNADYGEDIDIRKDGKTDQKRKLTGWEYLVEKEDHKLLKEPVEKFKGKIVMDENTPPLKGALKVGLVDEDESSSSGDDEDSSSSSENSLTLTQIPISKDIKPETSKPKPKPKPKPELKLKPEPKPSKSKIDQKPNPKPNVILITPVEITTIDNPKRNSNSPNPKILKVEDKRPSLSPPEPKKLSLTPPSSPKTSRGNSMKGEGQQTKFPRVKMKEKEVQSSEKIKMFDESDQTNFLPLDSEGKLQEPITVKVRYINSKVPKAGESTSTFVSGMKSKLFPYRNKSNKKIKKFKKIQIGSGVSLGVMETEITIPISSLFSNDSYEDQEESEEDSDDEDSDDESDEFSESSESSESSEFSNGSESVEKVEKRRTIIVKARLSRTVLNPSSANN